MFRVSDLKSHPSFLSRTVASFWKFGGRVWEDCGLEMGGISARYNAIKAAIFSRGMHLSVKALLLVDAIICDLRVRHHQYATR